MSPLATSPPFCPSAQPEMDGAVVFGVVGGSAAAAGAVDGLVAPLPAPEPAITPSMKERPSNTTPLSICSCGVSGSKSWARQISPTLRHHSSLSSSAQLAWSEWKVTGLLSTATVPPRSSIRMPMG